MSMKQNGMETYMMKTTKRHLIILLTLFLSLFGVCNTSWGRVYWKPDSGNDSYDGSEANKAVKTWRRALELLSNQSNSEHIYLCEVLKITANTTMDGAIAGKVNARLTRNTTSGFMITVNSGCTLTLKNITISGTLSSSTPNPDGVKSIIATSGVVILDNGAVLKDNFAKSEAEPFAGAIRLYDGSKLTMKTGSLISNCHAGKAGSTKVYEGGAIMCGGSCTVNINGGTIENCTAKDIGGAICLRSGNYTFNMTGGTIKGCSAPSGGGIYIAPIKKDDNTYSSVNATVKLTGGKIENCTAANADGTAGHGGGVYIDCNSGTSTFKMISESGSSGTEISGCNAITLGGGIYSGRTTPAASSTLTLTLTKGKIHDCRAEGPTPNDGKGRGGALAITAGVVTNINGSGFEMYDNYAKYYGGGVQLSGSGSILNFSNGYIGMEGHSNTAPSGAAGIHVTSSATFNMSGGHLCYNESGDVGGGFHSSEGCTLSLTGGKIYNNIALRQGGGINVNTRCNLEIPDNSTLEMYENKSGRGGAIMVDGAILTVRAGSYHDNQALSSYENNLTTKGVGGAFCIATDNGTNTFAGECYLYGGTLNGNSASIHGGAIYIGETTSVSNGGIALDDDPEMHILGAATISNNSALNGHGGGIYMASGTFEMTDGTIDGNSAAQDGGGFYVTTPTGKTSQVDITGGTIEGNSATYGGGFAVVGGTCNIKGAGVSIGTPGNANTASYGAGLYADGGTTTITKGNVQYNEASQDGGGIYANGGTVNVQYAATTDGKIHHNYAGQRGGGLFISSSGSLNLEGKTTLEYNRVPKGELGGGVYLEGTVQAGASSSDVIVVKDNYADNIEGATITSSNRNNIYLPNPTDVLSSGVAKDVITVVNNGLNLGSSKIGFSVPHNFVPVIYCATTSYLSPTIMNSDAIFEDSERYTKYYSTTAPYKANYIYLSADTWFAAVGTQPSGFSYDNIDSPEDLAWLISIVNGRTTPAVTASSLSGVTVRLTADIDMKAHTWVPIGYTGKSFNGTFDGNGHTISNVFCNYLGEGEGGTGRGLGLFGTVENATIHDVFVNGVELEVKNQTGSDAYSMGAIANEAKGTTAIYNCTAASKMESTMANTTMGGLVGKLTAGTIHSSAAMPDMTGYTMGGLAGTSAGTIYNSFANPRFKYSGTANACFVGGLAASNSGTIQNCYVRFSRTSTFANAAKFGQIVGQNTGSATVCYHPTTYASGIPSALVHTGSVSSTVYGDVVAPYLYYHGNDNLVGSTGVTLCNKLNEWVASHSGHSTWKRTSAGAYSAGAGNINGDYPIHRHTAYTCAASTNNGVNLDYATSLDIILARHTSNATVNLYAHDRTMASTGNGVVVYIDQDISLLQDVGQSSPSSSIEAYTCQTIPGDPRSWHFISSSLDESGIGFGYSNYSAFNWDPDPCGLTFSADNDHALFPSDMPAVSGMDLYAFFEPEYHWINLKRRSDSHWHMNDPTLPIEYANEATLTPGKGYLVSIDQDQLLQNRGTLNNGTVTIGLGYTPANTWAGLVGYNLIGNPYQSYLNFSEFARVNSGLWYDGSKGQVEPTYAVYDGAMGGYVQYKEGSSRGSKSASGMLNMHQGFMIRTSGTTSATFNNGMRSNNGAGTTLRGEQPAYPLINLTVTDDEGVNDFAVLELGRETEEGAEKLRANDSKGWLYLHHGSENYGILFRTEVDEYQPLWFEAEEAGTYTLSWETANGEFDQLTLIDNITGEVTDMLTHDSYAFEATPEQYKSRFKIVVGEYKDTDENIDGPSTGSGPFAYYANGEIHLVETFPETSQIQIVDMLGRVIVSREGVHTVSTNGMAPGVYILRLTDNKGTRTQKIILE